MSSASDRLAALFARLEASKEGLGLARALPASPHAGDKQHARRKLEAAVMAISPHKREAARSMGISERYLRDMLSGRNEVQAWVYSTLPRAGKIAWIECELDELEALAHRMAV